MSIRRCVWGVLTLLLIGLIAGVRADEIGAGAPSPGTLLYTSSMVEYFSSDGLALSVPYVRVDDTFLAKVEVPQDAAPGEPASSSEGDVFSEIGTPSAWASELLVTIERAIKPIGRR
jgi:hypothetical protein